MSSRGEILSVKLHLFLSTPASIFPTTSLHIIYACLGTTGSYPQKLLNRENIRVSWKQSKIIGLLYPRQDVVKKAIPTIITLKITNSP